MKQLIPTITEWAKHLNKYEKPNMLPEFNISTIPIFFIIKDNKGT